MLTIQDAGRQILTHNPGKFYVFAGEEYGIKEKYISELKATYGEYIEADSVASVIDLMRTKHLIPLKPKLYIVRYDEEFASKLTQKSNAEMSSCKIIGTLVCIYESEKHLKKCGKYLPDFTVVFDKVDRSFICKYLKSDFPNLPENYIKFVTSFKEDYRSCWNVCNSLNHLKSKTCTDEDISVTFNCVSAVTDAHFKIFFANKNFAGCKYIIEDYPGQLEGLFYVILNTLIELDKLTEVKYSDSEIKEASKLWSKSDIFYMFMHTYQELKNSRKYSPYNVEDGLMYLVSLLGFSSIPSLEVL